MHWITSTLCKVFIHSWHGLVALDFFIDLMFIQLESLKKTALFSTDYDLKMQEMAS